MFYIRRLLSRFSEYPYKGEVRIWTSFSNITFPHEKNLSLIRKFLYLPSGITKERKLKCCNLKYLFTHSQLLHVYTDKSLHRNMKICDSLGFESTWLLGLENNLMAQNYQSVNQRSSGPLIWNMCITVLAFNVGATSKLQAK